MQFNVLRKQNTFYLIEMPQENCHEVLNFVT